MSLEATFVPGEEPSLLLWTRPDDDTPLGEAAAAVLGSVAAVPATVPLAWPAAWARPARPEVTALETVVVQGLKVAVSDAAGPLARLPSIEGGLPLTATLGAWSVAAKLALELVARHRVVPWAEHRNGSARARWRLAPDPEDAPRLERIATALPPAARACTGSDGRRQASLLTANAALRGFLDAVADGLVRASRRSLATRGTGWSATVAATLVSSTGELALRPVVDAPLVAELQRWAASVAGTAAGPLRLLLRLEVPAGDDEPWPLAFAAAASTDPSLQLEADQLWAAGTDELVPGSSRAALRSAYLAELGRAARLWPPLSEGLRTRRPSAQSLAVDRVVELVSEGAPLLRAAGIEVRVPSELTAGGRRRLRARLQVRTRTAADGASAGFSLHSIADARWEAMLDDVPLTPAELERLAGLKRALVRLRGRWVLLDRSELDEVARRVREGDWRLDGAEAIAAALERDDTLLVDEDDPLARLRTALLAAPPDLAEVPGMAGRLRPYQRAGAAWLERLDAAALGGVLADDMGLGKTAQVLAFLLRRAADRPPSRPHLVVCPTSVLGSWEREVERFAPSLGVYRHYGRERVASRRALTRAVPPGTLCLTTYGTLRRDRKLLAGCRWETVVLDEAQAIKNPDAQVARAACTLEAGARFALTGTPVENRLSDLWSIFRFAVPGLLGPERRFRTEVAVPVERYRSRSAVERLHRLTGPFLLRRAKTDPAILPDLPSKLVVRTACPLTAEQATLYRAAVDEAMEKIRGTDGMDRRGRVLALITTLKQVCNHPEQILGAGGRLADRSGKLDRLGDELEEVLEGGEAALVFTQYRTMGELLVRYLAERVAVRAPFLHGGVARTARERMVARFQEPVGPPVMVISLRAGGTGLTLTRASHVYHFDRWWNPAVEDQASDRAHRIGQQRTVVVHPMICRGTLEERIDRMLSDKADLAALVVRSGDAFLTELDDDRLEQLVRLEDQPEGEP